MGDRAVSVVVNCLNGERYLREALDSVFGQSFGDWELVFWDNASTDATAEIARSYGNRLRYFRGERTVPLGRARNLALAEASGEFIAFLDADDVWHKRKLERQIPLFDRPRVGLVYSDTIFFDERGTIGRVYRSRRPPSGAVFAALLEDYFLSMETVVIRRDALTKLDEWFDDEFGLVEEKDLFLRIAHDWEFAYADAPLAKWRVRMDSESHRRFGEFGIENARLLAKLRERVPDLDARFPAGVAAFERKIVWQRALGEWLAGNGAACRSLLRPAAGRSLKETAVYGLSYLGPAAAEASMRAYLRRRRS